MLENPVLSVWPSVDWITMTISGSKLRNEAFDKVDVLLNESVHQNERIQLWSSFGYEGWDNGWLRWGRRDRDDLLQIRGSSADSEWERWIGFAHNVTRLDLAVTVQFQYHDITLARDIWETVQRIAEDLPILRNYSIIQSLAGGDTLYVGKRASQFFGRIYDKTLESGKEAYANCWRYEVESKKPVAQLVAEALLQEEDKRSAISGWVKGWFEDRLIACPWTPKSAYNAIRIERVRSNDEKALEWLERQVKPTVTRLIARNKATDVLDALGIKVISETAKGGGE